MTTAPAGEPATVRPRRFDQAQELADKFKEGQSVILNLESTERDVARRLIDFASGVCYSLDGSMEKVATGVYLLKPSPQRIHRRLRRLMRSPATRRDAARWPRSPHYGGQATDPQRSGTRFKQAKRGYDPAEVDTFLEEAAAALEAAQNDATAMEARARAAVARLQELSQAGADAAGPRASTDESETISRTLLLAQRTADATVADAQAEAERVRRRGRRGGQRTARGGPARGSPRGRGGAGSGRG